MLNCLSHLRVLAAGFAFILVVSFAVTSLGQSGRRARQPAPVPVATPDATPSPTPNAEKQKPRFTFVVGLDRRSAFTNLPLYSYEEVLRSVTARLEDSPVVRVAATLSEMSRSDAVQKAKREKEGYIILLELELDTTSSDSQNSRTPDIIIEYSVLAPITAKQVNHGRTYTQSQRRGGILSPRTSGIYGDRYLTQAAQEAADRIMAYFRSHGPTAPIKLP